MDLFFLFIYLILILISILGYGSFFNSLFKLNYNSNLIGIKGINGLIFLTFISYFSHLFFSHNNFHNSIILILGIFFFLKEKNYLLSDTKISFLLFIILLPFLIIIKTHDDFPYYHLPFILSLVENKLQFGFGHIEIAYNHHSSILYLQSLFYFNSIKYYLFNAVNFFLYFFFLSFLLHKIYLSFYLKNKITFLDILYFIFFIYALALFNRLAEFGTDRAGHLLSILFVLISLEMLLLKKDVLNKFKYLLLLGFYLGTIKVYLFSYSLILIYLMHIFYRKINFLALIKNYFLFFITTFLLIYFFLNLAVSGCLIYPVNFLCFSDHIFWSMTSEDISYLSRWLEQWAKSGAGPNFRVDNPENYIKGFNWIQGWFERYFFNKVSDYILSLLFLSLIMIFFFKSKNIKNFKLIIHTKNLKIFYYIILVISLFWFFKHPSLQYGGYTVIALLLFIPLGIYLDRFYISLLRKKYLLFILLISVVVFDVRNIQRIYKENLVFKRIEFPYFYVPKVDYEIIFIKERKFYKVSDMCWDTPSVCIRGIPQFKIINNYYFFYKL